MQLNANTSFNTILFDAFVIVVSELSKVEESTIENYLNDRINQDLDANGCGWEYGLIYLKTLVETVKNDIESLNEDEDKDAELIYDALKQLLENNCPETFIAIQGW